MKSLLSLCVLLLSWQVTGSQEHYLLVGTYDSPKSEGIHVFRFHTATGTATSVSQTRTPNPSFLAVSPDEKFVYAVHEIAQNGKGGEIAAFAFNKSSGNLSLVNKQSSGGDHPCYVAIDREGRWVFAGNYSGGNWSVFRVNPDGSLAPADTTVQHYGSGPNQQRQKNPHVHATVLSPDNKLVFVTDLGTDKVMSYAFDPETGNVKATRQGFVLSEPGSGPRHFTFHPTHHYAYLIEELSGTIVMYKFKKAKSRLKVKQRITSMPPGDTGFAGSAHIHVSTDGKFLYASNRGHSNTIAVFSIDRSSGKLTPIQHQAALGHTPRHFTIDPSGQFLLVGNQNSDEIVVLRRDLETGLLFDTGNRVPVGKPVCLVWIRAD